jgi:Acetyltransferase (GNAT) domain
MRVLPYAPDGAARWNDFVRTARNGAFVFDRNYMDYHADRFADASLMLEDGGRLVAVLPAHHADGVVRSHEGLTFGGFIMGPRMRLAGMERAVAAVVEHYQARGFAALRYHAMPLIYFSHPSQEDLAVLCQRGARLVRNKVSCVSAALGAASPNVRRSQRDALQAGLSVGPWTDLPAFYAMSSAWLSHRHQATLVHRLEELQRLCDRFPQHIRIIAAWKDGQPVAGLMLYDYRMVQRLQYMACTEQGWQTEALKFLYRHLIETAPAGSWIDFGTSMEPSTGLVNRALHQSKESLGARTLLQSTYELTF